MSPLAASVFVAPTKIDLVLPGERLSRLDQFVRLQVESQKITFLRVLEEEGLTPGEYAAACVRLDHVRRMNPAIDYEYRTRLARAMKSGG